MSAPIRSKPLSVRQAAIRVLETWNDYIGVDLDDPATVATADGDAFEAHVAALKELRAALERSR